MSIKIPIPSLPMHIRVYTLSIPGVYFSQSPIADSLWSAWKKGEGPQAIHSSTNILSSYLPLFLKDHLRILLAKVRDDAEMYRAIRGNYTKICCNASNSITNNQTTSLWFIAVLPGYSYDDESTVPVTRTAFDRIAIIPYYLYRGGIA